MKLLSFIKDSFDTIVTCLLFVIITCFICVFSYGYYNSDEQTLILKDYSNIEDNFYTDNSTDANIEAINRMDAFISSLSTNVAKVFSKDWVFIVTDNIPINDANQTNSENIIINGASHWRTRTVFILSDWDIKRLNVVFVHELGHCFDYEFGSLSSTDEFKNIYLLYKDTYVEQIRYSPEKYAASSESEFFATLFKEYFISPHSLKLQAPEAYDYIDTIYKKVSGDDSADTTLTYDLQSVIIKFKNEFKKLQSDM